MHCSSYRTYSCKGKGTVLGVNKKSFASNFSLIVYSSLKVPKPQNSVGYWSWILCSTALLPDIIPSDLIADNPSRLFCKLWILFKYRTFLYSQLHCGFIYYLEWWAIRSTKWLVWLLKFWYHINKWLEGYVHLILQLLLLLYPL